MMEFSLLALILQCFSIFLGSFIAGFGLYSGIKLAKKLFGGL